LDPRRGRHVLGTHICVFYEIKQDLLDTAVSYFEAGLHSNEFCVCAISDPITEREAMNMLARAIPDLDRHLAVGQIELLQGSDARALRISPRTVEFHRTNLLKKVGARNTVDLLRRVLGE
jgi:hypothetical protein